MNEVAGDNVELKLFEEIWLGRVLKLKKFELVQCPSNWSCLVALSLFLLSCCRVHDVSATILSRVYACVLEYLVILSQNLVQLVVKFFNELASRIFPSNHLLGRGDTEQPLEHFIALH